MDRRMSWLVVPLLVGAAACSDNNPLRSGPGCQSDSDCQEGWACNTNVCLQGVTSAPQCFLRFPDATCNKCLDTQCLEVCSTCADNGECVALQTCLEACKDSACQDQCLAKHQAGMQALAALLKCMDKTCNCLGNSGGSGGQGGGGQGGSGGSSGLGGTAGSSGTGGSGGSSCQCTSSSPYQCSGNDALSECKDGCHWTTTGCGELCTAGGYGYSLGCGPDETQTASTCYCGEKGTITWGLTDKCADGLAISFALYDSSNSYVSVYSGSLSTYGETSWFAFQCQAGHKICAGAWASSGASWGCGQGCSQACESCCFTCELNTLLQPQDLTCDG